MADRLHADELDGAMAAAFGRARGESILRSIERVHGPQSRVLLHDAPGAEAPVVRLAPPGETPAARDDVQYEIVGEIATGGVGVVFKGRDRDLGRDVALKVLRHEHAQRPEAVARFVEEAQIAGQLQHPGIVPVYGLGLQGDGRPYFTMKLIQGRTLAALLKERKEPADERGRLLQVFAQVCQTMAYAHSRGVIHRDLKPSNVMVGSFGEVHVVDWGFGKVLGRREEPGEEEQTVVATARSRGEGSESISGSIMGTPAYMPPEQALGHVEELDERADVFALGAILCELLTGDPPYTGRRQDLLVQAAQARLDDAFARLDGCDGDPALVALCRSSLAPIPHDRPDGAAALAETLAAHFAAAEERARAAEVEAVSERARLERGRAEAEWARRARRVARWGAASLVLAVIAGAGLWFSYERDRRTRADAARPQVERALESSAGHAARAQWEPALADAQRALALVRAHGLTEERAQEATNRAQAALETARRARLEADMRASVVAGLDAMRWRPFDDRAYEGMLAVLRQSPELPAGALRERYGAALDRWTAHRSDLRVTLLALAQRVDPHPLRDEIRRGALPDLAEADARTIECAARFHPAERLRILEEGRRRHPADLWLNLELARALEPVDAERATAFREAAHALKEAQR